MPAIFRRKDGELLNFNLASRKMGTKGTGGYGVLALEDSFLVGGGTYRLEDGAFIASVDADVNGDGVLIGKDADGLCAFGVQATTVESTDRRGRTTKKLVIPKRWSILARRSRLSSIRVVVVWIRKITWSAPFVLILISMRGGRTTTWPWII